MGRTNPTFRDFLEDYESGLSDYRGALRYDVQDDFDHLFKRARTYVDAAGYANHLDRDRLVLLSMALGHEVALRECEKEIEALHDEVESLRAALDEVD